MQPRSRLFSILALCAFALFAILAIMVANEAAIVRLDRDWVSATYHFAADRPTVRSFFIEVTNLGAGRPLWLVGSLAVVALAVRREFMRALIWAIALLSFRRVIPWLKGEFGRVRPEFIDWEDFSFPSGHAFGSAVVYGMLALVVLRVWHGSRWRWVFAGALWLFLVMVALSRPMLGVHYPSDVLAGMCLGLGWGFFWAALADWFELRQRK